MAGASITLLELDDELTALWDAPVHTRHCGGAPDRRWTRRPCKRWLEGSAAALHEQRDYLTQLDAAIGDADHGTNMDRGFSSVVAKLAELDGSAAGQDPGHGRLDAHLDRRRRERPAVGHCPAAGRPLARRRRGVRRRGARRRARGGARRRRRARRRRAGRQDDGRRARAGGAAPPRARRSRAAAGRRRLPPRARRPRRGCRRPCHCRRRRAVRRISASGASGIRIRARPRRRHRRARSSRRSRRRHERARSCTASSSRAGSRSALPSCSPSPGAEASNGGAEGALAALVRGRGRARHAAERLIGAGPRDGGGDHRGEPADGRGPDAARAKLQRSPVSGRGGGASARDRSGRRGSSTR